MAFKAPDPKPVGPSKVWWRWLLLVGTAALLLAVYGYFSTSVGPPNAGMGPPMQGVPSGQGSVAVPSTGAQRAYRVVRAAFGTDRLIEYYADRPGSRILPSRGRLTVGIVEIAVPYVHKMGEVERPSLLRFEFKEDPSKHVVLLSVKTTTEEFKRLIQESVGKKAFVFVHGYKTTFEDAALRTAQIAVDLGLTLFPSFFSWPSQGSIAKYTVDEANAEWTEPHLATFLAMFADGSGAREIVIIAHSMGTRPVTRAMSRLLAERPDLRTRFRDLVLAAPDIDADVFKTEILPKIVGPKQRVTLYASSNDKALRASKEVHGNPRAGESGAALVVAPGLETIDASSIDTDFFGHSYFAETRPLLTDLELLVGVEMRAEQRPTLEARSLNGQRYWAFRP